VAEEASESQGPDPLVMPGADDEWAALYTYSRREKQVAQACSYLDITHDLPLRDHWTGPIRPRRYRLPLFPSHVFARLAPVKRADLLRTGAIFRVIRVDHPEVLLDELRQIRAALEKGADLIPGQWIKRGERVRVVRGQLMGVEGIVTRRWHRQGRLRLVLNVSALKRAVALNVDAADVERVRTRSEIDGGGG
jgi:hypothetical protein